MSLQQKMLLLAVVSALGQLSTFLVLYGDIQGLDALYREIHTGTASNEFQAAIHRVSSDGFYMMLMVFPVVMAVILSISLAIARGVRKISHTLAQAVESRNLTLRMPVEGQDELANIARAYNKLMDEFSSVLDLLDDATGRLRKATDTAREVSGNLDRAVQEETLEIEQVATAMNEMAATVQEVARNAATTAEATERANQDAATGLEVVDRNRQSIESLVREIDHTAHILQRLSEESSSITTMLNSIRGIAEQTNLLALNAAIEAARAGEQGRGFAVVADEVRTLAQRTQDSTTEIEEMVGTLLDRIDEAVAAMESGQRQAETSVGHARDVSEALDSIRGAVEKITQMNLQVATATEEQGAVAEEINRNITNIANLSGNTKVCADKVGEAGQVVEELSQELISVATRFRAG